MHKNFVIVTGVLCCLASAVSGLGGEKVLGAEAETLPQSGEVYMYRLYNPNSGEHFYSSSKSERNSLVSAGWEYEGIGWVAPTSGTPVYRLYNPCAGDHVYTADSGERDTLKNAGWKYEGICWYSDTDQTCPVYRQYNPNASSGSHNFTTSDDEKSSLIDAGWTDEGVAWYAEATASSVDSSSVDDDVPQTSSDDSDSGTTATGADLSNVGNVGNLTIPSIGTDVALYNNASAQSIVDRQNSAAYLEGWAEPIIADHRYQSNFRELKNCTGQYCYVTVNGTTTKYRCDRVESGTNTGSALITSSGVDITVNRVSDLVIYTCQSSSEGGGVWITEWNAA